MDSAATTFSAEHVSDEPTRTHAPAQVALSSACDPVPRDAAAGHAAIAVAAGGAWDASHSLVLLANGQVVAFGDYACGQLGDPWRHEDGGLPRPVPCDWEQSDELA